MNQYQAWTPHATTILGVRRGSDVALAGDGQVTMGDIVLKHKARKLRTLHDGQVIAGFAGAVADALTLFGTFETHLQATDGNLRRAAVALAKEWRSDRYLRRLEAQLIVTDGESLLVISGEGDVIEPDDGIVAIGSGAPFATAAAKALMANTDMTAEQVVREAMRITEEICIYTNKEITVEVARSGENDASADASKEDI
jgi:ATP-dependent HslUV protease, peptidase subunit HslV